MTTKSAIQILERAPYHIDQSKLKHIDHGVRMHHRSEYDRLAIKESLGLGPAEFIQDRQCHRCGRGPVFKLERTSIYQRRSIQAPIAQRPLPAQPGLQGKHEESFGKTTLSNVSPAGD